MASLRTMLEGVRSSLMPTLATSAFIEKGVLTPEEFVAAGDELVAKCPTWEWARGDASKAKPFLPKEKQYLVSKSVPSMKRVSALGGEVSLSTPADDGGEFGDWLEADLHAPGGQEGGATVITSEVGGLMAHVREGEFGQGREGESGVSPVAAAVAQAGAVAGAPPPLPAGSSTAATSEEAVTDLDGAGTAEEEEEEDYLDMDTFDDDNLAEAQPRDSEAAVDLTAAGVAEGEQGIVAVRTYAMHVVYDNFYRTPRVYLTGSAEDGRPLSAEDMQADVVQDYVQKTVTMESHPHLDASTPHISIHPCQHAATMQRLLGSVLDAAEAEGVPNAKEQLQGRVGLYMFLFLKFVQSVIPTIEYDTTADYDLSLSKATGM